MALPLLKQTGYTLEDWQSWEGRWELINGQAYDMTPAPTYEHQRVSAGLLVAMTQALAKTRGSLIGGGCDVLTAPLDVFLPSGVFQPDLVVVCDPAKRSERGVEGAPDLIVEILSPRTAQKDWSSKRWAYEAAGVPEYLIVDPDERFGVLFQLIAQHYGEGTRVEWGGLVTLLGGELTLTLEA